MTGKETYDYVIVGSGFGGSVSALRLSEKGYKVLVIEKGKWFSATDFPKTNWNLRKWLWAPGLRFFGIMRMSFFRHISIVSGVGVGGGSLVYANTLPIPKSAFFKTGNWAKLNDWEEELRPFYNTALQMLGATRNPKLETGDLAMQQLAKEIGKEDAFEATQVAVFFGEPGQMQKDPYFGGKGPDRAGCIFCGACMTGCRHHAKNTLDKNYLYLAQQLGTIILAETEVTDLTPMDGENGKTGYQVHFRQSTQYFGKKGSVRAKGIVFAGGVLGTVKLLLKLKLRSLPRLSSAIGTNVLTNNESLIAITSFDKKSDFSKGVAIGSILHTDADSHLEPVRYGQGSGFWRWLLVPMTEGRNTLFRVASILLDWISYPVKNLKVAFVRDWAKQTQTLLFMQHLESAIRFKRGWFGGIQTALGEGKAPSSFIPRAGELARKFSRIIRGKPNVFLLEQLAGIPTTAHILGGCPMGADASEGVIDRDHRVFGYENMFVCDGSAVSANPGVNPSLTITALAERAMSKVPLKSEIQPGNDKIGE